mgnify:CR=1 FL=1
MAVLDVEIETNVRYLIQSRGYPPQDIRNTMDVFPTPESFIKVWQLAESIDDVMETLDGAGCTAFKTTVLARAARYRKHHHVPLQCFPPSPPRKPPTDWGSLRELARSLNEKNT